MIGASPKSHRKHAGSVKRILAEAQELNQAQEDSPDFHASPLETDLFEWHFTIRLRHDEFAGGIYHGRILLPSEYPLKPPDIVLLTPNGRFELGKKICLSMTGFHQETWQPSWGIRTCLLGLMSFFTTEVKGAIGGIDCTPDERRRLAGLSKDWTCPTCAMKNKEILPEESESEPASKHKRASPSVQLRALLAPPDESQPAQRLPEEVIIEEAVVPAPNAILVPQEAVAVPAPPAWIDRLLVALVVCLIALVLHKFGFNFGSLLADVEKQANATSTASVRDPAAAALSK